VLNKQEQQTSIQDENNSEVPLKTKNHGRLFVNEDGQPYSKNTIQSFFNEARTKIREAHPYWYYRAHDLRATFATDWLYEEASQRSVFYDFLIQELSVIMGHESTSTTQKYIEFMNAKNAKIALSGSKNKIAQQTLQDKRS
jgi:integrase